MQVHVLTEPVLGPQLPVAVVPAATYGELHPGSPRVPVCLCNLSACAVDVPVKWLYGRLCLPIKYLQWSTRPELLQRPITQHKRGGVFEALDLQGLKEWPESEQKQARELLLKWEHLFTHSDLDLGKLL